MNFDEYYRQYEEFKALALTYLLCSESIMHHNEPEKFEWIMPERCFIEYVTCITSQPATI